MPSLATSPLKICVWVLVLIGLASRLSPLADPEGRLFWQYMTEDGYLMQTVARNIAIGLGMSTAEGTIPTNGVQPLATILFAALHFLAGGSKPSGIALVTLLSVLVSAVAGYLAYKVASRVFSGVRHGHELAILSAALWFAAPHVIAHSMNGLETGVYYAAILFTLNYYLAAVSDGAPPFVRGQRLVLGLLLGLTFLVRNDAVFFIGGLLLAHLLLGGARASGGHRHRLGDCLVAGFTSILVATPWLAHNHVLFGSIVPISGVAQSHGAQLGEGLAYIPANLFEATFLFAPVPRSLEPLAPVILMSIAGVGASLTGFWFFAAKLALPSRRFFLIGLIFATGLSLFYGLFFGATWFLPRYITALSPFLWFATSATVLCVLILVFRNLESVQRAASAVTVVLTIGACAFAYSNFAGGRSHMHKQVVEWVQGNVEDVQWVGAIQTGTLGFFHDRTINLDGKVNPDALRARIEEGHVLNYVLESRINYLVDWVGILGWKEMKDLSPQFSEEFDIVVKDEKHNLGVLRRRVRPVE